MQFKCLPPHPLPPLPTHILNSILYFEPSWCQPSYISNYLIPPTPTLQIIFSPPLGNLLKMEYAINMIWIFFLHSWPTFPFPSTSIKWLHPKANCLCLGWHWEKWPTKENAIYNCFSSKTQVWESIINRFHPEFSCHVKRLYIGYWEYLELDIKMEIETIMQ